jgi:hypothetical protein
MKTAAEVSYREVLDATKHQDDKVGRIITAAAFLTTGALALVTFNFDADTTVVVPGIKIPVVALGVGIYLAFTALAVVVLLLSLSTPFVYLSNTRKNYKSIIFFHEIGRLDRDSWKKLITEGTPAEDGEPAKLPSKVLEENFIAESLNLSRRVKEKYRRTYFAVRAFQVGIFYLVVGGIAFLFGFAQARGHQTHSLTIYPNYFVRAVFFLIFVGYMSVELIAVRDASLYEREDWDTPGFGADQRYSRRTAGRLALGILFSFIWFEAVLIFLPISDTWSTVLFMAATGLPLLVALHRPAAEQMHLDESTGQCRPIDGGSWRCGHTRRQFHWALATVYFVGFLAIGGIVTGVDSALARIAAASAGPILLLAATVVQRSSRSRPDKDGMSSNAQVFPPVQAATAPSKEPSTEALTGPGGV